MDTPVFSLHSIAMQTKQLQRDVAREPRICPRPVSLLEAVGERYREWWRRDWGVPVAPEHTEPRGTKRGPRALEASDDESEHEATTDADDSTPGEGGAETKVRDVYLGPPPLFQHANDTQWDNAKAGAGKPTRSTQKPKQRSRARQGTVRAEPQPPQRVTPRKTTKHKAWAKSVFSAFLTHGLLPFEGGSGVLGPLATMVMAMLSAVTEGRYGTTKPPDARWYAPVRPSLSASLDKARVPFNVGTPAPPHPHLEAMARTFVANLEAMVRNCKEFPLAKDPAFQFQEEHLLSERDVVEVHPQQAAWLTENFLQTVVQRRRVANILAGRPDKRSVICKVPKIADYAERVAAKRANKGNTRDSRVRNTLQSVVKTMLITVFKFLVVVPVSTIMDVFPLTNATLTVLAQNNIARRRTAKERSGTNLPPCYIVSDNIVATMEGGVEAFEERRDEMIRRLEHNPDTHACFTANEWVFLLKMRAKYIHMLNDACCFGIQSYAKTTRNHLKRGVKNTRIGAASRAKPACNQFGLDVRILGYTGADGEFHKVNELPGRPEDVDARVVGYVAGKALHAYVTRVLDAFDAGRINAEIVHLMLEFRHVVTWYRGGPPTGIISTGGTTSSTNYIATSLILRLKSRKLVIMGGIGSVDDAARFARLAQRLLLMSGIAIDFWDPVKLSSEDRVHLDELAQSVSNSKTKSALVNMVRASATATTLTTCPTPPELDMTGRPWKDRYEVYQRAVQTHKSARRVMSDATLNVLRNLLLQGDEDAKNSGERLHMRVVPFAIGKAIEPDIYVVEQSIEKQIERDPYGENARFQFISFSRTLRKANLFIVALFNTPAQQNEDPLHTQFIYRGSVTRNAIGGLTGNYTSKQTRLAVQRLYDIARPFTKNLKVLPPIANDVVNETEVTKAIGDQSARKCSVTMGSQGGRDTAPAGSDRAGGAGAGAGAGAATSPTSSNLPSVMGKVMRAMEAVPAHFYPPVAISRDDVEAVYQHALSCPNEVSTP